MAAPLSPEFYRDTRVVESYAQDQLGTLRSITQIAPLLGFMDPEEFISYIYGKEVLDVGSGLNGLAIDVLLQGLPTGVTSINPAIYHPRFERQQIRKLLEAKEGFFPDFTPGAIELARIEANKNCLPFFAHDLQLPSKKYDVVIDNLAVFYYTDRNQRSVLVRSLEEMMRVCRGSIRVGDFSAIYGDIYPGWKEQILKNMRINYRPYRIGFEIPNCG